MNKQSYCYQAFFDYYNAI